MRPIVFAFAGDSTITSGLPPARDFERDLEPAEGLRGVVAAASPRSRSAGASPPSPAAPGDAAFAGFFTGRRLGAGAGTSSLDMGWVGAGCENAGTGSIRAGEVRIPDEVPLFAAERPPTPPRGRGGGPYTIGLDDSGDTPEPPTGGTTVPNRGLEAPDRPAETWPLRNSHHSRPRCAGYMA